ncbi:UDP-N-acetylmuramoyl-tripeptide--D-alanyl-D-alanine ligase [Piscibacillus halophilus]|uniref:UDP-N-acetylmuramoyl-tripeptide--D-alanyl-D- alanine ligase n=1 Tax=Piscibacillus halophilus TaxID=571933 RepID=UPI002409A82B|nr:UDP-N-acetylmuramoyl-tripeptide--D-alanyl-D-alanine ligase [Piscibacillus halophilus]
MKKFDLNFLAEIFPNHTDFINQEIHEIYRDSREKVNHGLFVPIIGDNFDAHDFIPQAIENGAVAILSSREELNDVPEGFPVFYVEDTIEALQTLANRYRHLVDPIVVGITGSNGKTTTKEIVASCLATKYIVWKTKGNLNNHIGLPLTVLSMEPNCEVLVAEMGMSGFGEIERLSHIVQPDYGIITNIGESHIEYLGSREGIAKAKLEITAGFSQNSVLIYDGDEPLIAGGSRPYKELTCGFSENLDYVIRDVRQWNDYTEFTIKGQNVEIPLLGKHQAKNSTFAYALCEELEIDLSKIKNQLKQLQLPSMRFEQIRAINGATIINDAYNASATSMIASIDVLKHMNYNNKIVVLGDILELGEYSEGDHRRVGESIDSSIDQVLTIGADSRFILEGLNDTFEGTYQHFDDKSALTEFLKEQLDSETVILFKASRGIKLEEIVNELI